MGCVRSRGPTAAGTATVVVVVVLGVEVEVVVVLVVELVVVSGGDVTAMVDVEVVDAVRPDGAVDAAEASSSAPEPHAAAVSAATTSTEAATGRIGANVPHPRAPTVDGASGRSARMCRRTIPAVAVLSGRIGRHGVAVTVMVLLVAGAAACGADAEESAAARGSGLYGANCAACHGDDLDGTDRGPSLLEEVYLVDELSDAAMADAIRNGVDERLWNFGPMPAAGGLSDAQVREIIAHVRSRQAESATSP